MKLPRFMSSTRLRTVKQSAIGQAPTINGRHFTDHYQIIRVVHQPIGSRTDQRRAEQGDPVCL